MRTLFYYTPINISTELKESDIDCVLEAIRFACLEDLVKKLPEGIKTVFVLPQVRE